MGEDASLAWMMFLSETGKGGAMLLFHYDQNVMQSLLSPSSASNAEISAARRGNPYTGGGNEMSISMSIVVVCCDVIVKGCGAARGRLRARFFTSRMYSPGGSCSR